VEKVLGKRKKLARKTIKSKMALLKNGSPM
jgi:hypothetical protein